MKWFLVFAALISGQEPPKNLNQLIEKLGSDVGKERDDAQRSILELGTQARPALLDAVRDKDPERSRRAMHTLRLMEISEKLTPHLTKMSPSILERLAAGTPEQWADEFLGHSAGMDPCRMNAVTKADCEALAVQALTLCRSSQKLARICDRAGSLKLDRLSSALIQVHANATDPSVRSAAALAIGSVAAPEGMSYLSSYIRKNELGRQSAIQALERAGDKSVLPSIIECVYEDNGEVAKASLDAALALGGQDALEKVAIDRLGSGKAFDRFRSIFILGLLGRVSSGPALLRLLIDSDSEIRIAALRALRRIPLVAEPELVARRVSSSNQQESEQAARTLVEWGVGRMSAIVAEELHKHSTETIHWPLWFLVEANARREIPRIAALLKDRNAELRAHALWAVGRLKATESAPDVLRVVTLRESDCAPALATLGRLKCKDAIPALVEILVDPDKSLRISAALSLSRLGDARGLPILLDSTSPTLSVRLFELNAVRSPEIWARLEKVPFGPTREATPQKLWSYISKAVSLTTEVSPVDDPQSAMRLFMPRKVDSRFEGKSLLDALEETLQSTEYDAIFESDRILFLPTGQAHSLWKMWWENESKRRK